MTQTKNWNRICHDPLFIFLAIWVKVKLRWGWGRHQSQSQTIIKQKFNELETKVGRGPRSDDGKYSESIYAKGVEKG